MGVELTGAIGFLHKVHVPDQEVIATSLSIFICTKYGHLPGVVGFGSGQYGLVFISNGISQNM